MFKLDELHEAHGVSGNENEVRTYIKEAATELGYRVKIDHIGNLICYPIDSLDWELQTLVTAHMDEVGLMITEIKGEKAKFTTVGRIDPRNLPSTVWTSCSGVKGVIGLPAPHITKDANSVVKVEDLRLDFGDDDIDVEVGDTLVMDSCSFTSGDSFFARNVDNRIGCYALLKLMENAPPDTVFAFLVREEVGLKGISALFNTLVIADQIRDHINIDVCLEKPGVGPCVVLKDGGYLASRDLIEHFKEAGAHEFTVGLGGTSDHAVSQVFCNSIGVGIPSSYIHSGVGKINLKDVDKTVALVTEVLYHL